MTDDAELLRRYAEGKSEEAFAELVRRNLGLVYHAALRQCGGDAHRAEDVAQMVFTDLARKAGSLPRDRVLVGWLYTSTRYAAAQAVRTEVRRQQREQAAHLMDDVLTANGGEAVPVEWENVRPVIDEALHALGERDREAVLLRFFEGRAFAEVGAKLAVSEDAARMRVDRALEKMRAILARHGVTSTTAALGVALAGQSGVAAPAGLAAVVTGAALTGAAAGGGVVIAVSFMTLNSLKISLAAAVVLAGVGGLVLQHRANIQLESELAGVRPQSAELARLRAENDRLAEADRADQAKLARLQTGVATRTTPPPPNSPTAAAPMGAVMSDGGKPALVLATGLKPAASFINAGRATPREALETQHWATNGGNAAVIAEGIVLAPTARQKAEELLARLPADKRGEFGTPEQLMATLLAASTQVAGAQVMNEKPGARAADFDAALANDPSYQTLHLQVQYPDGRVRENDVVFQQAPDGWHQVVPPWQVGKMAELMKPVPATLKHDGGP